MHDYPLITDFLGLLVITFSIGMTIGLMCGLLFYDFLVSRPTLRILNEELHRLQEHNGQLVKNNQFLYANNQRYEEIISGTGREKRTQEDG